MMSTDGRLHRAISHVALLGSEALAKQYLSFLGLKNLTLAPADKRADTAQYRINLLQLDHKHRKMTTIKDNEVNGCPMSRMPTVRAIRARPTPQAEIDASSRTPCAGHVVVSRRNVDYLRTCLHKSPIVP